MKRIITSLLLGLVGTSAMAQWSPAAGIAQAKDTGVRMFYKLDLEKLKSQLAQAPERGSTGKPVEILMPTLDGKVERFAVYSFPVMVKELADQYHLGSYIGVGIDDPEKSVRFSVAPNDFQSMMLKDGVYQFIDPQNADKTVYGVHPKTKNTGGKGFLCSMDESVKSKTELDELYLQGKRLSKSSSLFGKMSDKKYRTMRLAMSVTGEYTTFHGGTVAGALAAINATMTRVNGVFEKDFALHLNVQNFPAIIYTDATNDPYSDSATGSQGDWNLELQNTLTSVVGEANYDIGHLFGDSGGGGNAGCIGCVCISPTTAEPEGKGSGFTSPANDIPQGDAFDIDYVAHEMGHQLGANHTFSHVIEGTGVNMEPGSGSTIMGYAGITNANVQMNSDAYFHVASIYQVQLNLMSKTCDVETPLANNPPVITMPADVTIPKGTAFVLTGTAVDPENDPMTYTWEQSDSADTPVTAVTGNNTTGAFFRSLLPSTSPTRYFPKLSSVLNGNLTIPADWETVPNVARDMYFALTVRDNNAVSTSQQTEFDEVKVTVATQGPFKINTTQIYQNVASSGVNWDVVGTSAAPFNVANVKIDYTTNNGTTWTTLAASTPNDGSETFSFPTSLVGQNIKLRISAINNIFYAVKQIFVTTAADCTGAAPTNVVISNVTSTSASVSWNLILNATYIVRYKKSNETTWSQITSTVPNASIPGLEEGTVYDVQIAAVCSGVTGTYTPTAQFVTSPSVTYCTQTSSSSADEYIANVTLANVNNTTGAGTYTNYGSDASKIIYLTANSQNNTLSVTKAWTGSTFSEGVKAWIDFNRNGTFEASEMVMNLAASVTNPVSATFSVPSTAVLYKTLKMRVAMRYNSVPTNACTNFTYGEVEDYNVVVGNVLATSETTLTDSGVRIYPNPATDVLNVTKVSDKAAFKIHNAAGQLVKGGTVTNGQVRVSELVRGTYVISISDKNISESLKFIKK